VEEIQTNTKGKKRINGEKYSHLPSFISHLLSHLSSLIFHLLWHLLSSLPPPPLSYHLSSPLSTSSPLLFSSILKKNKKQTIK
jgi:hypothetical protein